MALRAWGLGAQPLEPITTGHINWTARVRTPDGVRVVQRLNPIFSPDIHHNIAAVTGHLAARQVETPELVPTLGGALWTQTPEGGIWRLLTYIDGVVLGRAPAAATCAAAGHLLGRFHCALADFTTPFRSPRPNAHNTPRHLDLLRAALADRPQHPAAAQVAALAAAIVAGLAELPALATPRKWVAHGDAKLANIIFARPPEVTARALIDLDTLGLLPLVHELGDAWRSWCAGGEESQAELVFQPGHMQAAWHSWREQVGRPLLPAEHHSLPYAMPTIALELAARFARDALEETYFAWDHRTFAHAWQHNLLRARGQLSLATSALRQMPTICGILSSRDGLL